MLVFWEVGGCYGEFAAENWRRRLVDWWLWYEREKVV
jgi:hypothetical protein